MNHKIIHLFTFLFFAHLVSFGQSQNFVVEPYLQDVDDSSFTVMWETSMPGKGQVYLATASRHVLRPELQLAASEKKDGVLHKLTVEDVSPGELYFYQVASINNGDTLRGPVTRLSLPDYAQSPISFTVVGDNQGHVDCWEHICQLMLEETPNFVIHVGDMVSYGHNKDDWTDEFLRQANMLFSHVPVYPAIGNHEMNDEKYYQYFAHTYDDAFYSIKKGNLRVIFVDTNKDILEGSFRYHRLEQTLANCKEQWKIVVHHHPLFTSDVASYRSSLQAVSDKGDPNLFQLKKLYEDYGVDLVLSGHVHGYERSFPISKNHIDNENGVTYVITAGGGGGLNPKPTYKEWFSREIKLQHNFLNIRVLGNKLTLEAIDTSRIVFDSWTKEKPLAEKALNAPLIDAAKKYFIDSITVTIYNTNECGFINCRLNDGGYQTSYEKKLELPIHNTATVSAFAAVSCLASNEAVKTFTKLPVLEKQKKGKALKAEYYDQSFTLIPDFDKMTPTKVFNPDSISNEALTPKDKHHFAMRYTGSFTVPETDVYRFTMESFDGSRLFVDGKEIIDNDGVHYEITKEACVALEKGIHNFEVQYFDFVRRKTLNIKIGGQYERMDNFNKYIDKDN